MPRTVEYVVVYDIADDGERNRTAKILEGFGIRVQLSAFECQLTRGAMEQMKTKLGELKLDTGFVLIYRRESRSKRTVIGRYEPNPLDDAHYAYVI